jgi:ribonuclease P protein component
VVKKVGLNKGFPLRRRLTHSFEFDAVFDKNEVRINSTALLLIAKPNSLGFNRLGMIVSKKSIPKAVQRSKVKRKLRETFRKAVSVSATGWDIVAMTRSKLNSHPDLTAYLQDSFTALAEKFRQ